MTTYPIVRFVDAVGSFTPRLGLNEDGLVVLHDGFTPGSPTWDAAPDSVGGRYGHRTVEGVLRVRTDSTSAARYMQAFAREILRDRNVLLFQFDERSEPMWLRTYRTEPEALDLAYTTVSKRGASYFRLPWKLRAAPFARKARVTHTVELLNNASGASSSVRAGNLASYPSAEGGTTGWASSSGTVVRTTAASGLVGRSGSWQYATSVIPAAGHVINQTTRNVVVATRAYSAALSAVAFAAPATTLRMRWRWFNAANAVISTVNGPTVACGTTGVRLEMANQIAPAGATSCEIGIEVVSVPGTAGALIWDSLMPTESATVQPYRDGSSAGWGWSGQPHASPSGPLTTAGVAGGVHVLLPPIEGDSVAECRLTLEPSTALMHNDITAKITAYDEPGVGVAPITIDLDDDLTASAISAQTSASGFIGAGYRATSITNNAIPAWMVVPLAVRPGTYHVFARVQKPDTSAVGSWRLWLNSGDAFYSAPSEEQISEPVVLDGVQPAISSASLQTTNVDLGLVTLPVRAGRVDPDATAAETTVALMVQRLSSSAQLRLDALILVPHDAPRIDGRVTTQVIQSRWRFGDAYPGSTVAIVADPDESSLWLQSTAGVRQGSVGMRGGFLEVHPGVANVLTLFTQTASRVSADPGSTLGNSDTLTSRTVATISYEPEVLYLPTSA